MSKTFEQGKEEVAKLCQYFATNRQVFLAPDMKEAQVRQTLIDPLFEALGWDVHNRQQVAPQNMEVVYNPSLDDEGERKEPDYAFRFGRTTMFYAEAKKCAVDIGADPGPACQLRRYGWSAKAALSLLTNFEELGVYDCTLRPHPADKASRARTQHFRYDEYRDRWREIWDVFSHEAFLSGKFDQYAASKRKRGTSEVDVEFLKEIEGWRDALARNIALRNKDLSSDDLNAAVQRTIDRVVFLRMAEDRGIEAEEQLLKLCERDDIYRRFMRDLCRKADEKYNSGLFHFQKEDGVSEDPDRITPRLTVDDKVFKPILQSLYFAHGSPYQFGVLPVEILGTVYERFLGKVIRLRAGHQAKIEEKPEVRKAGGVYYTPKYIVDYIVRQTVGRKIEGRSPAQLAGVRGQPPFRVLDMACGSGSFLLGAYQCLLEHCLKWFIDHNPDVNKKAVYKEPRNSGQWRLTIEQKKRILTTHIFGVDIDPQAVEVSKLSLLLKALEGENDASLSVQMKLFHDRALPNLADNIKCGNSLIGHDFYENRQLDMLNIETKRSVNCFDWPAEFPQVFQGGGFDVLLGNPPYVRIHNLVDFYPLEIRHIQQEYRSAQFGKVDIYVVFVEKGLSLLNSRGVLGFIVPNKFMQADYGIGLRTLISERKALVELVDFSFNQVFARATTYTCLLFLSGSPSTSFYARTSPRQSDPQVFLSQSERQQEHQTSTLRGDPWSLLYEHDNAIFEKMQSLGRPLSAFIHLGITGVKTGANSLFVFETDGRRGATWAVKRESTGEAFEIEAHLLRPYCKAESLKRYHQNPPTRVLLYPYELSGTCTELIPQDRMSREFPRAWDYLLEHKRLLESRQKGKLKGPNWYGLSFASSLAMFQPAKIVTPTLSPRNSFSADRAGRFFPQGAGGGCGLVPIADDEIPYILGILNSRLLTFFFQKISSRFQGGWFAYEPRYLRRLPIYECDLQSREECRRHDRIAELVETMLRLHEQLLESRNARDCTILQRQIDATDAEIDRLVYNLYGLTAEEVAIVERATN